MQPALEQIPIYKFPLSEARPIIGLRNVHRRRSGLRWDMHYGLELGLACSGKERRYFFDQSAREVEAGQVWFCGMWEPHGMQVVAAPCEVIILGIWPPLLAQMHFPEAPDFCALAPFNAPPAQRPAAAPKTRALLRDYGRQLKGILAADTPYQTVRLRLALQGILLCMIEAWPEAAAWRRRAPSAEFSQINQALQLVFESQAFVSTDTAARACGMNRHKFSALFQSWMNIRFADFSLRHRLHQATAQLRATPDPIKLVALRWGFADESHFHRLFVKHYGFSPQEYRNRMPPEKRFLISSLERAKPS